MGYPSPILHYPTSLLTQSQQFNAAAGAVDHCSRFDRLCAVHKPFPQLPQIILTQSFRLGTAGIKSSNGDLYQQQAQQQQQGMPMAKWAPFAPPQTNSTPQGAAAAASYYQQQQQHLLPLANHP